MRSISIVLPIYNEEKSIYKTISELKEALRKSRINYEIIAVNDGSTDNSPSILKKIKGIKVIEHPYNKGYGASLKSGIKKSKNGWILTTDVDGTYPLSDIPRLIKGIGSYDMVVGARIGEHVKIPILRKPAKYILGRFANYLTKRKIPDLNSGLRVFKKELALRFWDILPPGFSFTTTITIAAHVNEYSVKYIPINYYTRKGKSTIHPVKDFIGFIGLIFRTTMYFEPLKIFIPVALILFLLALLRLVRDLILLNDMGDLATLMFLTAFQIFFFGLLADLINKRTKS
ncbi:MAG: glycosyltransferase family 2 protein [Candidatus Woesearchaeota archaeon]